MKCHKDPSLLLVSRYSSGETTLVGLESYVVRNLTARRGIDGPQIILSWDEPLDPESVVTSIRITRKLYDFSVNELDGDIVYEGPYTPTSFSDCEDLPSNKCVYYTVWSFRSDTSEWVSLPSAQINILSLYTGDDHWRKLFYFMGEAIIVGDKDLEHNMAAKIPLDLKFAEDGECFNIHEFGEEKGPLARFFKIFGALLDEARELIRHMPEERNPNEACYQYLDLIATILGFEINRDLPINKRRVELKNRVKNLKIKGTLLSISAITQQITGFQSYAKDWCDNSFIVNESTTVDTDLTDILLAGTEEDYFDYLPSIPGDDKACDSISIYIDLKSSEKCVSESTVNKLERAVKETLPVCTTHNILWRDEIYEEEIPLPEEEYESEFEDEYEEELNGSHCWFIVNDEVQGITNSHYTLPLPFGICEEEWFDIIEEELLVSVYSESITEDPEV